MEPCHTVRERRRPECEHRHPELPRPRGARLAQGEELLPRDPQGSNLRLEVFPQQVRLEPFVPRRDGSVGGEDAGGEHHLPRLREGEAVRRHQVADPFDDEERGVSLVHVVHGRLNPEGFERPGSADAEQDLLPNAHVPVPPVEGRGDLPGTLGVSLDVAVEEVQGSAADVHPPDSRPHHLAADVHRDLQGAALRRLLHRYRHVVPVVVRVQLLLPPVQGQHLAEISLLVQEPDADERDPEVGSRLQVVPREDSEPPGVDREPFVDPVLARKIGHPGAGVGRVGLLEPRPPLPVLLERPVHPLDDRDEALVLRGGFKVRLRQRPEHLHRILVRLLPENGIQPDEELHRFPVPREPEVPGDLLERSEFLRDVRSDVEMTDAHGYLVERSRVHHETSGGGDKSIRRGHAR